MTNTLNFEGWVCPLPLRDQPNIIMGHGGGGKLSAELVEHLFLPAFKNDTLDNLSDSAIINLPNVGARLAFSTDSYVVQPLFFPGGNIGELAVHGTVNDIAMSGAQPLYLSTGFIIEEGMPLEQLGQIVESMAVAARQTGVTIVTGDTKVVDKGHGDGLYINTAGFGLIPEGVTIGPHKAQLGDVVLVSGEIGVHGIAIMSVREGLTFETVIESDTAPLHGLVADMLAVSNQIHALRDPTRGGVASALNEIAAASQVGIVLDERNLPISPPVRAACEILGLDPLYVANEGKLIAIVPAEMAEPILECMRQHPYGQQATIIGQVTADHSGLVVAKTGIGGTRIVDMQVGEQLPRIC
ncbi:hydrogenase expression/formation protein HypE [Anaerolineales bacterium HSG24]|nr:hydrogenase expression/formation protein HypE [Anaerolineales bacterium HSG24]